jgi:hypothetical protein
MEPGSFLFAAAFATMRRSRSSNLSEDRDGCKERELQSRETMLSLGTVLTITI